MPPEPVERKMPMSAVRPAASELARKIWRPAAGRSFWSCTVTWIREVLKPSAVTMSGLAVRVTEVPSSEGPSSSGTSSSSMPQPPSVSRSPTDNHAPTRPGRTRRIVLSLMTTSLPRARLSRVPWRIPCLLRLLGEVREGDLLAAHGLHDVSLDGPAVDGDLRDAGEHARAREGDLAGVGHRHRAQVAQGGLQLGLVADDGDGHVDLHLAVSTGAGRVEADVAHGAADPVGDVHALGVPPVRAEVAHLVPLQVDVLHGRDAQRGVVVLAQGVHRDDGLVVHDRGGIARSRL